MRVFLDASVLIWGFERPASNSGAIVEAFWAGRFDAVVDEQVLAEVGRYARPRIGRSRAWLLQERVRQGSTVVTRVECEEVFAGIIEGLKPADRLHLAACRTAACDILVAFDRDFSAFPEYVAPREAAKRLGLRVRQSPW